MTEKKTERGGKRGKEGGMEEEVNAVEERRERDDRQREKICLLTSSAVLVPVHPCPR